jgi:hypothetical protein
VSTSTPSQPCGIPGCGRDPIGKCQGGCGRRLCGLHGPVTGSFVCAECTHERAERDRRQRELAQTRAKDAVEKVRADVAAELAGCAGPREVVDVLTTRLRDVAIADCKATWVRLAGSGAVQPTHEIVNVNGRGTPIGWLISRGVSWERGSWTEPPDSRRDLWCAPGVGCDPRGRAEQFDVWLDAKGGLWRSRDREVELSIYDYKRSEYQLILPKGAPFKTRRGSKDIGHRVVFRRPVGAVSCEPLEPTELGSQTGDLGYARVVAATLAHP